MDSLTKKDFRFTMTAPPNMPNVGPVYAELLCGSCRELTDFSVYVGRSLGIPCAVDFSPMRGDVNDGHLWTVYFSGEDTYVQDFPYGINILQKDKKIKENKLKVYRKQFCVNKLLEQRNVTTEYIYPFFSPPLFDDVTIDYADNNFINVFHVPDTLFYDNIKRNGSLAYLCLSKRMEWIPVDYGEWKHKILSFYNFQAGVIMRIAGWDGFKLIFYTPPFMIDKECNIKVFKPDSNKQDIVLYSKTNLCTEEDFLRRMIGGVFEGSNDCSFYSRDTLFCIKKESPRLFTEVKVFNDKMYRYVRYMGPADSYCNVSEIKFIGEYDQELRGNIIGTEGDWDDKGTHTYLNVYDDKTETSFDYKYPSGGWSGMDLGEPRKIKKIIYSPRNRDNYVRKNDVYELFYFDREWKSLGIIRSTSDSLLYKDVPKNALFYLKNHTRGVDERVFIYENNKSIFL